MSIHVLGLFPGVDAACPVFSEANAGAACIGALREASSCQTTVDCEAGGYGDFFFGVNKWEIDGNLMEILYIKIT